MMYFRNCRFDFDTNRVEAILSDGSRLSIDCIAVENELVIYQLRHRKLGTKLHFYCQASIWLLFNNRIPSIFKPSRSSAETPPIVSSGGMNRKYLQIHLDIF